MEEIYGDFAASLGDRVKKRRRINYCEDDDDDDVMTLDEPESKRRRRRHYSDDSRSPSPEGDYLTSPFYFRVRFYKSIAENYRTKLSLSPFALVCCLRQGSLPLKLRGNTDHGPCPSFFLTVRLHDLARPDLGGEVGNRSLIHMARLKSTTWVAWGCPPTPLRRTEWQTPVKTLPSLVLRKWSVVLEVIINSIRFPSTQAPIS